MNQGRGWFASAAALIGFAYLTMVLGGCMYFPPREFGRCTRNGAIVGAVAGAGSGIAIVENAYDHRAAPGALDTLYAGLAGAFVGALILGAVGHYYCDPLIEPPPRYSDPFRLFPE